MAEAQISYPAELRGSQRLTVGGMERRDGILGDVLPRIGSPAPLQALWWSEGKGMNMQR